MRPLSTGAETPKKLAPLYSRTPAVLEQFLPSFNNGLAALREALEHEGSRYRALATGS